MVASSSRDQARMPPARLTAWKPFCCRNFATSQAAASGAAQHDHFAAAVELAEAIGDLAHRNVHDVRHAGHAELPAPRERQAASATRRASRRATNSVGRDFGNGHGVEVTCAKNLGWRRKVTGSEHECRGPRRVDQRLETVSNRLSAATRVRRPASPARLPSPAPGRRRRTAGRRCAAPAGSARRRSAASR